jgi:hypothetical protein
VTTDSGNRKHIFKLMGVNKMKMELDFLAVFELWKK